MKKPRPEIWIVDDDPIFRMILTMTIKNTAANIVIKEYENGQDALNNLQMVHESSSPNPSYIFLDINMPELNGWQFLESIDTELQSELAGQSRIFVLSSSINPDDKQRAMQYDLVTAFLVKPISSDTLRTIFSNN